MCEFDWRNLGAMQAQMRDFDDDDEEVELGEYEEGLDDDFEDDEEDDDEYDEGVDLIDEDEGRTHLSPAVERPLLSLLERHEGLELRGRCTTLVSTQQQAQNAKLMRHHRIKSRER